MSACGEPDHSDTWRIEVPLVGTGSYDTEHLLDVLQRSARTLLHVPVAGCAVLEHEGRHAERIERPRDRMAFLLDRYTAIAAARTNDHCGHRLGALRHVSSQRRPRHV